MRAGKKHMENQNKIFKPRIEMPVISAILFSGNENVQNWHFQKCNIYFLIPLLLSPTVIIKLLLIYISL
jgi:putative effector of murein hydrolase